MNEDFELTLFDRIEMIRSVMQYVPDERAYISYSGGKDSVVLSHLIDEALPNNKIDRVFCDTGIEFQAIVDFVKEQQKKDHRIRIIAPKRNIKKMLEDDGYPFKSKLHSEYLERYQKSGLKTKSVRKYISTAGGGRYHCPKKLLYQFTDEFNLKVSQKCCYNLKKKPFARYAKEHGKTLTMTGIRSAEGGIREYQADKHGCVFRNKDGTIYKFNPLSPCSDEFMEWYINSRNIELCKLYYDPYNFKRTGCKGCPYSINVAQELEKLEEFLPHEYKACETIWKPVYAEYRRIAYRDMNKAKQLSFNFEENNKEE